MYDSELETRKHQQQVGILLCKIVEKLLYRARAHDSSKLVNPEKRTFDEVTPRLKALTYGSEEYTIELKNMGDALAHHYLSNRHHPEHFENGISGMNLVDIIEMFCDWKAATLGHKNGDIRESVKLNESRFSIPRELVSIFENTINDFSW